MDADGKDLAQLLNPRFDDRLAMLEGFVGVNADRPTRLFATSAKSLAAQTGPVACGNI